MIWPTRTRTWLALMLGMMSVRGYSYCLQNTLKMLLKFVQKFRPCILFFAQMVSQRRVYGIAYFIRDVLAQITQYMRDCAINVGS